MRDGNEPVAPREDLSLAANFLYMLFGKEPDEREAHALDVSLILHAEHEFNASTFTIRVAAGTYVDLHSALTAALASLKGPRHGGANEDVIDMIEEIGDPSRAEGWARDRLARYRSASREQRADPSLRFPGFGHAVYRVLDPRARVLKTLAAEIAERKGVHGIAEIQESVANVVTSELGIYPNVDYYSAGLYHALGVPKDMFTSIFATSRTSGWIAHYEEQLREGRLIRPRGEYHGPAERPLKR
jgi:citrate synthase